MAEPLELRAMGAVNWIGLWTLYTKEVQRFFKVFIQTVIAPVMQTLLFMAVLALAWGGARGEVLGVAFPQFLAPGLVMMAILVVLGTFMEWIASSSSPCRFSSRWC